MEELKRDKHTVPESLRNRTRPPGRLYYTSFDTWHPALIVDVSEAISADSMREDDSYTGANKNARSSGGESLLDCAVCRRPLVLLLR